MVKRALLVAAGLFALAGVFYTLWAKPSERGGSQIRSAAPRDGRARVAPQKPSLPSRRARENVVVVETRPVLVGSVEERLNYVGSLLPQSSVQVASKVAGRVEEILVEVGDRVARGLVLARLDKREFQQEVREAEASLRVQEATLDGREAQLRDLERRLERSKLLFKKDLISRQEAEDAETQFYAGLAQVELTKAQISQMKARLTSARLRLADTEIISPFAGYVAQRHLERGAIARPDAPILSLVEIDPVKTVIAVVERDYRKVRPGMEAAVAVDSYPGRRFSGTVARIAPVLDRDTRTAEIEIEVPNPQGLLKPGMFARATLTVDRRAARTLVPEAALVRRGDAVGVFKLDGESDRVKFVTLEIGVVQDGSVEVVRGVSAADRVVTLGAHLLQDGARVRIAKSEAQSVN